MSALAIPIIGDLIREVGQTVREFIPDADKKADLQLKLAELADAAEARENALILGQLDINLEEAKNSNIFVAGWRPAIGWTGAIALGWTWVIAPTLQWGFRLGDIDVPMPALSPEAIYPIIIGMLGLGTMRTVEKMTGTTAGMNGEVLNPVIPQRTSPAPRAEPTVAPPAAPVPETPRRRKPINLDWLN